MPERAFPSFRYHSTVPPSRRRLPWRLRPSTWRVAWWATLQYRSASRQLRRGVIHPSLRPPPMAPLSAGIGMDAALTRVGATCLEAALVRQSWLGAHGENRDVVIGVIGSGLHEQPAPRVGGRNRSVGSNFVHRTAPIEQPVSGRVSTETGVKG